jgi:hypothetical protein
MPIGSSTTATPATSAAIGACQASTRDGSSWSDESAEIVAGTGGPPPAAEVHHHFVEQRHR